MKLLFLLAIAVGGAWAQSISVNLPTSSSNYCSISATVLSGTICTLTVTLTSVPAISSVEYDLDGELQGIVRTAPYSFVWDTFYAGNGAHTFTAIARNITNTVLATSSPVSFSVENDMPQHTCPPNGAACTDITVTTGELAQIGLASSFASTANLVSFQGSGPVSLVGSPHVAHASNVTFTPSSTSDMIACFVRWQTNTATLTLSDNNGDSFTYGTLATNSGGFSSQWGYTTGAIHASSTTVTAAITPSQSVVAIHCYELNGASTSSPLDVNLAVSSGGSNPISSPVFTLAFPSSQEFIIFGATWSGVTTATAGPAYTLVQDSSNESATEYIEPTSGVFSYEAITTSVNGPNSGISKNVQVNVDGYKAVSIASSTAATNMLVLNTAQFTNTLAHNVVVTVTGGNCPGCTNGSWNIMGQWEQQQTFANGSAPSQLLLTFRDAKLCVTPSINCPSSITQTATVQNADGTTGTASSYSWVINYASVNGAFPSTAPPVSLSATSGATNTVSVVSGMQNNATSITVSAVTAAGTLTRTFWINIPPDAVGANTPHFGNDGSIITTGYDPAKSLRHASAFFSGGNGMNPVGLTAALPGYQSSAITSSFNYPAQYGPLYAAAGFNLLEGSIAYPGGATEAQYDAYANSLISTDLSYQTTYGLAGVHLTGDNVERGTPLLYNMIYGTGATYVTPVLPYFLNQAGTQGLRIIGVDMVDEVSSIFPGTPFAGIATSGIFPWSGTGANPNGFVSIDCTVSPAVLNVTYGVWGGLVGSSTFIVHGSGDASLDYNFTSGNAAAYVATSTGTSTYTFPRPAGCTTLHNYANNPNMQIEPLVNYTYDATNKACPVGGTSAGPCPNYIHYNALYLLREQWLSATNPPYVSTPVAAGGMGIPVSWWGGKLNVGGVTAGDYDSIYWTSLAALYLPDKAALSDLINSQGNVIRQRAQWNNLGAPVISEASGVVQDYMSQGFPISIASCSGNTITTTLPHSVYNIQPGLTRMTVTGSSSANCDGNWYILASPTATTLAVAQANTTVTTTATGGTITFQDGTTWPLSSISPSATGNGEAVWAGSNISNCPNTWKNNRGKTFTLSGTSQSAYNSNFTGVFMPDTQNVCPAPGLGGASYWRQLPNITASTGGSAQIIQNHWLLRGDDWPSDTETGPRYMFASNLASLIWGAAGVRVYQANGDPQLFDPTLVGVNASYGSAIGLTFFGVTDFNCNYQACPQAGIDPRTDYAKSFVAWVAHTTANLMARREIPYAFGQRLPAPDYGRFFEAAAWSSTRGNLLAIQSFSDNTASLTANLAPYLETGQTIYRICAEWNAIKAIVAISAGTTSDTHNYAPGEHCAYIFANNAATELQQPAISARLADVTNAATVMVQFSYAPLAFTGASVGGQTLYQTQNCGNGALCLLNVDRSIGPVYYRLLYLNSSNAVIATSDIQTL